MSDPRTFHIESDKDGFFIVDDDGEEINAARYRWWASAKTALDEMVADSPGLVFSTKEAAGRDFYQAHGIKPLACIEIDCPEGQGL